MGSIISVAHSKSIFQNVATFMLRVLRVVALYNKNALKIAENIGTQKC